MTTDNFSEDDVKALLDRFMESEDVPVSAKQKVLAYLQEHETIDETVMNMMGEAYQGLVEQMKAEEEDAQKTIDGLRGALEAEQSGDPNKSFKAKVAQEAAQDIEKMADEACAKLDAIQEDLKED